MFVVGPESVRMLDLGHPWIIADKFTAAWPKGAPGEVIALTEKGGRFLGSALYAPGERIVARVLDRKKMAVNRVWLLERLTAARDLRRNHLDLAGTNAYRLVNGEGDGLSGLTVDLYGDYLMLQSYSAAWKPYLQSVADVLKELMAPLGIYEKFRPQETRELSAKGASTRYSRLLSGAAAPSDLVVEENGLRYGVDLADGLNTGLFPDQRENRRDLMGRVKGKTVLNLFAYTGAFSVAAAAAGAQKVISVDTSGAYLGRAQANFELNRLNPKRHEFVVDDCFKALERFVREKRRFDVVLFDPPSFSSTRKSTFATRGGTADLASAACAILAPGGLLIASSNHQKTELADYLKELRRGALQANCDLKVIGIHGQAADFTYPVTFPEGRYLKYVLAVKG
jgi:23S rRNA (cytosine1962-C5)-methyltransferase